MLEILLLLCRVVTIIQLISIMGDAPLFMFCFVLFLVCGEGGLQCYLLNSRNTLISP